MANSVDIANLQIKIVDNSEKAAEKVLNLAQALEELKGKASNQSNLKTVSDDIATLRNADMSGLSRLRKGLANALAPAKALADAMDRIASANVKVNKGIVSKVSQATQNSSGIQERVTGTTTSTASETVTGTASASSLAQTQKMAEKVNQSLETVRDKFNKVSETAKSVFNAIIPQGISRVISQLGRMMRMRLLRTASKAIFSGITEGLQNVYQWAKIVGDGFASTMDGMASSVLYLKNSIGAAFAQIVSLVAPSINSLIDLIVEGINYINMFFAVLAGQSTYTRAKKNAVEFAKAAGGAIGGASAAAKELKEQLTVLDFDELHQLQEQQTPSTGGGGGGGGGATGTDYSDMFEKADIEANWLTKTAGWLRDNFEEVLGIVSAIGAGILAWKITDALSNNIAALKDLSLSTKLGIALMVTGFVLEFSGAYSIGKEGLNLKNGLMTAIGTALAIGGSVLAFGSMGLALSIPLSVSLLVIGWSMGTAKRLLDELDAENAIWNSAKKSITESVQGIVEARELYNRTLNNWETNVTDVTSKFETGTTLLKMFRELSSKGSLDSVDLTKLQGITDAFNALDLTDVELSFDVIDGKIQSNIDDMDILLQKYKDLALAAGYAAVIEQNSLILAEAQINKQKAETRYDTDFANAQAQLQTLSDMTGISTSDIASYWSQYASTGQLDLENMFSLFGNVDTLLQHLTPENYEDMYKQFATTMVAMSSVLMDSQNLTEIEDVISQAQEDIDLAAQLLGEINGEVQSIDSKVGGIQFTTPYVQNIYEKTTGSLPQARIGGGASQLQSTLDAQLSQQPMLNIFADPTMNALGYTSAVGNASEAQRGLTASTEQATRANNGLVGTLNNATAGFGSGTRQMKTYSLELGGLTNSSDVASTGINGINTALGNLGNGVDIPGLGGNIRTTFVDTVAPAGVQSKNKIETSLNGIGGGMNYSGIMSTIDTGLSTAEKAANFAQRGIYIGGQMQSGSTSGYSQNSVISSIYNGLSSVAKATTFSKVGTGIGGDVQTGSYNGYSSSYIMKAYLDGMSKNQRSLTFSNVGKGMATDVQTGAYNTFSSRQLMGAIYDGMRNAEASMAFSQIGRNIAYDLKAGIGYGLNGSTLSMTIGVNGKYQTVYGRVTSASMYALGGYPQMGEMFIAGEAGAEAVGTIGGRTAVANRDQIASAIAMALQPMLSGGGETTTNVNVNMDSRTVARASLKGQRAMNRTYNISANA